MCLHKKIFIGKFKIKHLTKEIRKITLFDELKMSKAVSNSGIKFSGIYICSHDPYKAYGRLTFTNLLLPVTLGATKVMVMSHVTDL